MKKLDTLQSRMYEYLGIAKVEADSDDSLDKAGLLEFVRENIAPHITDEDITQYEEVLQALAQKLDRSSKLLEQDNMPSLVAIVAYSFEKDIDLDDWIIDFFERKDDYIQDQAENYRYMRKDLKEFIRLGVAV